MTYVVLVLQELYESSGAVLFTQSSEELPAILAELVRNRTRLEALKQRGRAFISKHMKDVTPLCHALSGLSSAVAEKKNAKSHTIL
jgi:hypothetical protein